MGRKYKEGEAVHSSLDEICYFIALGDLPQTELLTKKFIKNLSARNYNDFIISHENLLRPNYKSVSCLKVFLTLLRESF